jgi:threonyl-tRNA synthetase
VPYLIVVGDKEVENQQVAVRTRSGEDLGVMSIKDFEELLQNEVSRRSRK